MENLNLSGKKVVVRVDFNVPLNDHKEITDDTRMRAALPTLKHIIENGGVPVIMSHMGRPKGQVVSDLSLVCLVEHLSQLLGTTVHFADNCIGEPAAAAVAKAGAGEAVLLENLRFHSEETSGDEAFAEQLAALGDVYVNDAFGTAHRAHASTAIIAKFFDANSKAFGKLMSDEVHSLSKAMESNKETTIAIIGGAKVSSKIGVIENLMDKAATLVVGGGMSFTFVKAMGGQVGNSLVEDDKLETAKALMATAKEKQCRLIIPVDAVVAAGFADEAPIATVAIDQIPENGMGLDCGPKTIEEVSQAVLASSAIIWNGPMGVFEFEHYCNGTKAVGEAIAQATANGAFSLVGGGDSVAAVNKFGLANQMSYISTGGGAMLEYLEGKELPGVAALS